MYAVRRFLDSSGLHDHAVFLSLQDRALLIAWHGTVLRRIDWARFLHAIACLCGHLFLDLMLFDEEEEALRARRQKIRVTALNFHTSFRSNAASGAIGQYSVCMPFCAACSGRTRVSPYRTHPARLVDLRIQNRPHL